VFEDELGLWRRKGRLTSRPSLLRERALPVLLGWKHQRGFLSASLPGVLCAAPKKKAARDDAHREADGGGTTSKNKRKNKTGS
jgi:hypothetical protein